jgi:hypothetical protein
MLSALLPHCSRERGGSRGANELAAQPRGSVAAWKRGSVARCMGAHAIASVRGHGGGCHITAHRHGEAQAGPAAAAPGDRK